MKQEAFDGARGNPPHPTARKDYGAVQIVPASTAVLARPLSDPKGLPSAPPCPFSRFLQTSRTDTRKGVWAASISVRGSTFSQKLARLIYISSSRLFFPRCFPMAYGSTTETFHRSAASIVRGSHRCSWKTETDLRPATPDRRPWTGLASQRARDECQSPHLQRGGAWLPRA